MMKLDQKAEILIKYFREGKSQRSISKELKISRTTVRKYIADYESQNNKLNSLDEEKNKEEILLLIEEMSNSPKYDVSKRVKSKLTDEIINEIDILMEKNKQHRAAGRYKQQLKKIDIHEYLEEKGYDIGYTTVCNYIRNTYNTKEAYIRQEYTPGRTLEFDWGEVKIVIDGKATTLNMALFSTAKSSYHYARLYPNQKMESFLDVHVKVFNHIGGIHQEVVYDNMKQAVKGFVGRNEKVATDDLAKISLYYGFDYRFCNAASGNEKGHVERGVEFIRRKAFAIKTEFKTLKEANDHLDDILLKLNSKKRPWLGNKSPADALHEELEYLLPIKPSYDTSRKSEARVSKYSVINIDQNKYSVPDYLVGKFVDVKIYTDIIQIYYKEKKIANHIRSYAVHDWVIDINHFIHTLKKKPGALHSSVGRQQLSPELQQIYHNYYTNNPRDFIVLLELIKETGVDIVLDAIKKLSKVKKSIVTTENIKSLVNRSPTTNLELSEKDLSIQEASLHQISLVNTLFNLTTIGGQSIE